MIALPGDAMRVLGIAEYRVLGRLYSRRNEVWKISASGEGGENRRLVAKRFGDRALCEREAGLLLVLGREGAPVPRLLYHRGTLILTEYIEGPTLVDVLFRETFVPVLLVDALEVLYRGLRQIEPALVLQDMNLRNFILDREQNRVFRVDLESAAAGSVAEDLGKLCAFCLTYDPPFTDDRMRTTRGLFGHLVSRFEVSRARVTEEILREFLRMEDRRGIAVPDEVRLAVTAW
ncbi:MAG: hypothetical protein R6U70_10030 [Bacillota bacterium]